MKRSKIFLGLTTGLLAVVAFTAAKVAKFTNKHAPYFTNPSSGFCTLAASGTYFTRGSDQAKDGTHLLFSYNEKAACAIALYTKAGD